MERYALHGRAVQSQALPFGEPRIARERGTEERLRCAAVLRHKALAVQFAPNPGHIHQKQAQNDAHPFVAA